MELFTRYGKGTIYSCIHIFITEADMSSYQKREISIDFIMEITASCEISVITMQLTILPTCNNGFI